MRHATLVLFFCACGAPYELPPDDELSTIDAALTGPDTSAVLALVNYPGSDLNVLDQKVGLDARAAKNIVSKRNGPDGVAPSDDDDLFDTLAELDAVPFVGDAAFTRLAAYTRTSPAPQGETVEGVTFAGWESQAVVYGVNRIEPQLLDGMLDSRAAAALLRARPFTSVAAMGPLSYVGTSALARLKQEARQFWGGMQNPAANPPPPPPPSSSQAGTFDGVAFDEATAMQALRLANESTREQLITVGIPAAPAAAIFANRPYTSLAAVAAVGGVGTATMQALHKAATPAVDLKPQLESLTNGLWMPSETDARFFYVSATIGTAPVTEALIREKLGAQHDALIQQVMYVPPEIAPLSTRAELEVRDGVQFFDHIINAADPNDPVSLENANRFRALRDAMSSQLIDLKVYRFGTVNISTFILGRTVSGELVGLLTGQVET